MTDQERVKYFLKRVELLLGDFKSEFDFAKQRNFEQNPLIVADLLGFLESAYENLYAAGITTGEYSPKIPHYEFEESSKFEAAFNTIALYRKALIQVTNDIQKRITLR